MVKNKNGSQRKSKQPDKRTKFHWVGEINIKLFRPKKNYCQMEKNPIRTCAEYYGI